MAVLVNPTTGELGRKVSRSVVEDGSALLSVKWNRYSLNDEAGVKVSTATIEQTAADLQFLANTSDDTGISSYTDATTAGAVTYADTAANSIQETIDIINGVGAGQPDAGTAGYSTRWRAGLGDFRPGFALGATSGLVAAASAGNLMRGGEDEGLRINGDSSGLEVANTFAVGIGTGKAQSGGGQVYADHFESDYFSDTSGNRFPVRNQKLRRENQPGLSEFRVAITEIRADMSFADTAPTVTVWDIDNNVVARFSLVVGKVAAVTEQTPIVGPAGSPLFVEAVGAGILTGGPLSVTGEIRIA